MRSALLLVLAAILPAYAGAAVPKWLSELQSVESPPHDDETDAVMLLDEMDVTFLPDGSRHSIERRAYRILRRGGKEFGRASAQYNEVDKVIRMQGWSLPSNGKPFEVGLKDAIETALVPGSSDAMISDARMKVLEIPAANPGNIVAYEVEQLSFPALLGEVWVAQSFIPVVRSRFRLALPKGWNLRTTWSNGPAVAPVSAADGSWMWEVTDLQPIEAEERMPRLPSMARSLYVAIEGPDAKHSSFRDWDEMGRWFAALVHESSALTPDISQVVASRVAGATTQYDRIKTLSRAVQKDIRYVLVALGTTGYQPRAPQDVLKSGYGDCKDKANYLRLLLEQIGTESHLVLVNTGRGVLRPDTPPGPFFDHAVIAIRLPADTPAGVRSGLPMIEDGKGGSLLLFDPTDDLTPFGRVGEWLRTGSVLLVMDGSARLVRAPATVPADSGVDKVVTMRLAPDGTLSGDVRETWRGVWASIERGRVSAANQQTDLKRPVENRLAGAISNYQISTATVSGLEEIEVPFEWRYSIVARGYAKVAGDLMMVRPRVVGQKTDSFLDTGKERRNAVAFDATHLDSDTMRIELPAGFQVESLPAKVDVDIGFAAYHSRARIDGNVLVYERTYEQKELDLPLERVGALRDLYVAIGRDERAVAVLKRQTAP